MWLMVGGLSLTGVLAGMLLGIKGFSWGLLFAAVCSALFVIAYWQSRRASRAKVEAMQQRFDELIRKAGSSEFSLDIEGGSGLFVSVPMLVLSLVVLLFDTGASRILSVIVGFSILPASLVLLANTFSVIGQPVLRLSHEGIWTPHSPLIPWGAIANIVIQKHRFHSIELGSMLHLVVPDMANSHGLFHWFARLTRLFRFGSRRNVLPVFLQHTSEPVDVIFEMTCALWRHHTQPAATAQAA